MDDLKRQALELSSQGLSYGKIAEHLGIGKTTVYTWIVNSPGNDTRTKNVPKPKSTVPNELQNEKNEIDEFKESLQNDFGTDNDIQSLVYLRKAEMEHEINLERIELEREKLQHEQKMELESKKSEHLALQLDEIKMEREEERQESEQLSSTLNELKQENEELYNHFDNGTSETEIIELDEDLQQEYSDQVSSYLGIDGEEVDVDEIEQILSDTESIIHSTKKWCKKENQKKSDHPELSTLKQIRNSLIEKINEFEETFRSILVFDLDSEFDNELKESDF